MGDADPTVCARPREGGGALARPRGAAPATPVRHRRQRRLRHVPRRAPLPARARHARVTDAVTARQLLSIAPDDQQRVVDACSEPEHDAERGREAGESSTLHERPSSACAKAEALAVLDDDMLLLRGSELTERRWLSRCPPRTGSGRSTSTPKGSGSNRLARPPRTACRSRSSWCSTKVCVSCWYLPGVSGWVTGNRPTAGRGASECFLVLTVADDRRVDELVERARQAEAEVVLEPTQQPWGYSPRSPTRTDTSGR